MENNNFSFDPTQWVNIETKQQGTPVPAANGQTQSGQVTNPQSSPTDFSVELQKAKAVAEALTSRGANIAESYDDYLKLGFSLADGLGSEGRDIYHALCAQSAKYREADCEKKWQECLRRKDGRTTIATFYKMAQNAGIDLSAISREFSSLSSFPHGYAENCKRAENTPILNSYHSNNKEVIYDIKGKDTAIENSQCGGEEMRKVRKTGTTTIEDEAERRFAFFETFSDKLEVDKLPSLLRDVMETQGEAEDKDKVGLAATVGWSGSMPNVKGLYGKSMVEPALYAILNAPSGIANKGAVDACQKLLMPIEWEIDRQQKQEREDYERQHAEWQAMDTKQRKCTPEPKEPTYRSMFIAGNSSASTVYEDLESNGGRGTIFETEADTLAQVLTQEWGQWSDLLRKSFHHERLKLSRKNDNVRIVIERPVLAALLTCTPGQIPTLLPATQVENGLANRFLFYCLRGSEGWEDPFQNNGTSLDDVMLKIGQRYLNLYHALSKRTQNPLEFTFSETQKYKFNQFFSPLYDEQIGMNGKELSAFIFRLGLSTFRIAMVLTVLRCADREPMFEPQSNVLVCKDDDFYTALTIANTLINHTCHVYANLLPHVETPLVADGIKLLDRQRQFFIELPEEFVTEVWQTIAQRLNIPIKTAERYLGEFVNKYHLIDRIKNGHYRKRA